MAESIVALPPGAQRQIVAWAARWAWEFAGEDKVDWIAPALSALDRGDPMPPPWHDPKAAWDRVVSTHREQIETVRANPAVSGNAATWMGPHEPYAAATAATIAAAQPDPLRAVFGALRGAAAGQADRTDFLADLRRLVDAL